jgi:hypothetical protein
MSTDTDDILRRAWELREDFRKRGEFTTDDYLKELPRVVPELNPEDLSALARFIDRESTRDRPRKGLFDMEGEFTLRNGRRIARPLALHEHWVEALAVSDDLVAGWKDRN